MITMGHLAAAGGSYQAVHGQRLDRPDHELTQST
jgi:hypothetical protein